MPASFCGIYGMKATHGLVPYTGIMPIEIYVDHTGPMTRTVAENALLLEVLAGPDGYDPRQYDVKVHPYASMLEGGVAGMKIGMVIEGFAQPNAEPDVNAKVRAAAAQLKKLGAIVGEVSIPMHLLGPALWTPIGAHTDHDARGRLRCQPAGSLRHQPDGFPPKLAQAGQRAERDNQAFHATRHLCAQIPWQPLLRQGDEHHSSADCCV
jgi:Asp-tRNA(Asn)/Glu-tRNA(Gln) amidotransferase A subunit family amidase